MVNLASLKYFIPRPILPLTCPSTAISIPATIRIWKWQQPLAVSFQVNKNWSPESPTWLLKLAYMPSGWIPIVLDLISPQKCIKWKLIWNMGNALDFLISIGPGSAFSILYKTSSAPDGHSLWPPCRSIGIFRTRSRNQATTFEYVM